MTTHERRTIAPRNPCTVCRERWAQSKTGLCRSCQRLRDADFRLENEEIRRGVERKRPRRIVSRSFEPIDPSTLPVRVYYGIEYVIWWCGTFNGAAALGIPLAADRGSWLYDAPRGL